MKRTYQPSKIKYIRKNGFRRRILSKSGKIIIKNKIRKKLNKKIK
ncbi:50S ribosomal subunit protein L34 [Candidatus Zinderia insecticola CARI]|uniref:Large ribosomal subunit protein bL34 n=1 Tax=Zinderia insecticola (strain CARI) TaxID=871271 RepID=E0TIK8_ZINIC|nr:50S ribosomal subunit protein L34 [Candidatus Zinderia insecticola CARI]